MSSFLTPGQWENYKQLMYRAHETFDGTSLTWKRSRGGLDYNGEDNLTERFDIIQLSGLAIYNAFRSWPVNAMNEVGQVDNETLQFQLNYRYLNDLGYINDKGYFDFNPAADRFVHRGIEYKADGDTPVSDTGDINTGEPLHFYLILKREALRTGDALHEEI